MEQKRFQVSRRGSAGILTVLSLLWLMHMADRYIFIIALTPIKQAFSLSDAQAGFLSSLIVAGIAIMGIPAAVFGDRWARRKMASVMAFTWSVFTLVTGFATQFWHLVIARFMVGSGEAGYAPVGTAWLSLVFPREMRSRVLAVFFGCSTIGSIIGLVVGGLLISATGDWRTPFYFFTVPGIILAVIVFFLPDYKSAVPAGESILSKAFFADLVSVFKIKSFWLMTIGASFVYFMVIPLTMWGPTLLMRAYGMNTGSAGLVSGALQCAVLLGPLGGFIVDKWHRGYKNARPWAMAIGAFMIAGLLFIAMLAVGAPLQFYLVTLGLLTLASVIYIPVMMSVSQDIVPVGMRSTSFGVFNFVAQITGSTLGPIVVGAVSDAAGGGAQGIQLGLLWTVPAGLLGTVAGLLLLRYYPADSAGINDEVAAEQR
jgi:MFS transporter, Spinster family, sphingosine-1-phosphate transporter